MIREINVATGVETTREPTAQEIADMAAPTPTLEQKIAHMDGLVEELLNTTAKRKGYASSDRLAGYSASAAFSADALAFIAWRDAVWIHCTALLNAVMSGTVPAPTDAELLAGLPPFNAW